MLAGFLPLSPDNDDRNIGGKPGEGSGEGGDVLSDTYDNENAMFQSYLSNILKKETV